MRKIIALLLVLAAVWQGANASCDPSTRAYADNQDLGDCGSTVSVAGTPLGNQGALSPAGDINGDGTEDFAVSDIAGGLVHVIFGKYAESPTGEMILDGSEGFSILGEVGEDFGATLAGGYDINSDGFDDLVIGSPGWNDGHGRAFIIFGNDIFQPTLNLSNPDARQFVTIRNSETKNIPDCTPLSEGENSAQNQCPPFNTTNFGLSAAGVGDVNDDGLHDFLIGSHGGDVGAVLVFGRSLGTSWDDVIEVHLCDGTTDCSRLVIEQEEGSGAVDLGWGFGMSVSGGNDFNNDGMDDMMIGSPHSKVNNNFHAGLVAVYFGSDIQYNPKTAMRSLDGTTGYIVFGMITDSMMGSSVQALSDIDGDGIGDFAVSAPLRTATAGENLLDPHVYIFLGFGFTQSDENPRFASPLTDGGFGNPQFPQKVFELPHTGNSECVNPDGGDPIPCSQGFVIKGPEITGGNGWFGSSLSAGDLNNDGKDDLVINVGTVSTAYILWGQDHVANFTMATAVADIGDGAGLKAADYLCYSALQVDSDWQDVACGYMDSEASLPDQISKVSLGTSLHDLVVVGDINKDSVADMAYLEDGAVRIVPGRCDDGGDGCEHELNLPPGCKMDLAKLMVGFVDDDFIEWGRGYIRYVMEQMEDNVREAWDQNMIAKGFYVNTTQTQRCWCSPPDQRGEADGDWFWHCFEMDDLVCSNPEVQPDTPGRLV